MAAANGCYTAYAYPTDTETMNYNSVILVGVVALSAIWWVLHAIRNYPGPKVMMLYIHDDSAPLNQTGMFEKPHSTNEPLAEKAVLDNGQHSG